ncbi:hypothetical protein BG011_008314 [Mortierella polycephala]|uniref:N-acetyltransferase domain-containing protein n=1 Tax=Mortierella polycephala TaxID=41804 RepID=A0A9P6PP58_9FUNG|nr:hypothetical protein BG011_008314 [Mortierella polycephala]
MLTNIDLPSHNDNERITSPLPFSAVYNKQQFISQFVSLHHQSTQPTLVNQLLTTPLPNVFAEYWILYDAYRRPIACAGANTVMSDTSVGYVGLFEAKTEQAGIAVLKAATSWLRRGGLRQFAPVRQILGPVNMTTWLQYRLRVDMDNMPSMSFEPRHPMFYQACFEKVGFVKAADYYTTFFNIDQLVDGYQNYTRGESLDHLGLVMQSWNTLDFAASLCPERHPELTSQDDVAKRVYGLSIELFKGKELFDESLSHQDHRQIVLNEMISRPEVDNASLMDLSSFVVNTITGQDVGYLACWVEGHDTLVMKTVGFIPEVRKTRVFAISVLETIRRGRDVWGCTKVACALMNENSVAISERVGGKSVRHVYRLYIHMPQRVSDAHLEQHLVATTTSATAMISSPPPLKTFGTAATAVVTNQQKQQLHWEQQRIKNMAQRSNGRTLARL